MSFQCVAEHCGLVISVNRQRKKNCSRSWTSMEKQLSGLVYSVCVIEYITGSTGCSVLMTAVIWVPDRNLTAFCIGSMPKMVLFWFSVTKQYNLVLAMRRRFHTDLRTYSCRSVVRKLIPCRPLSRRGWNPIKLAYKLASSVSSQRL